MTKLEVALRFAGIGFYIGGSIVLGLLLGLWLDGKLHTRPLLAIVGLFLGLINAIYGVYRLLLPLIKSKDDSK